MNITSKIDAVTLFPRGAEISRIAKVELSQGEHEIILRDLPEGLVENSLRVEGVADGELSLGAVDSRTVYIPVEAKRLEASERRELHKQIEQLKDEMQEIEGRSQTAQTQKDLMESLADMPGSPRSPKTDWGKIYDLIDERLPKAHKALNQLHIERRVVQKKIDDLACKLADTPIEPKRCFEVVISASAETSLLGELTIRYQMAEAGWQPLYDARLETQPDDGGPVVDLVRRAMIVQSTGEPWDEVALSLSTTRPTGGTAAPDLSSKILDIIPDQPPSPMPMAGMLRKTRAQSFSAEEDFVEVQAMAVPEQMLGAVERETDLEQSSFAARFKVPGRVSLSGKGTEKKVRLGGEKLKPRLQIRSTPLMGPTAFLHADFELEGELALLPGRVALYRDNVYVGNGQMPLVNVGERHELGFGADDQVIIKRIELKRAKGSHGLIKTENTDEFSFRITITNHHKQAMPVRILDRIPVSNHDKLKVERLRDMSEPTLEDVKGKRGVLAFEEDVAAGAEHEIKLHYRLSWPKDERIG